MSEKKKIKVETDTPEEENWTDAAENVRDDDVSEDGSVDKTADNSENDPEVIEESVDEKLARLDQEVKANHDRFLRVCADFDNYKKRTSREMSDLRKYANENMLAELISVVDNLERAIESGTQKDFGKDSLLEGVEITLKDTLRILSKHGVKPFESEGKPFDPTWHQAMMQEETKNYPENTVLSEFQKGYMIHDRLLRPAMVVVSKAPAKTDGNGEEKDYN